MDWRKLYELAHERYIAKTFPEAYKDHGAPKVKFPKTDTANGLQMMIKNWCIWNGHSAKRTNSQGQARVEKVQLAFGNTRTNVRWTKGQSNGIGDIDVNLKHPRHRYGIPVKVEVKTGADTQRESQKEYEKEVSATGAIYIIVRTPEQWFEFYFDITK
jgi:hypothetical protein